ncbi:hypothetical protein [Autumnicola edwardsiae]|uniref:Uncharacterized protein n=1 Tax=Autumnicola edwardsiae TaxID=3075594 RepID=A0ABU3CR87_9FLAO|nr:hypothetical protein [Zunongwangia sp. F297]MDT0648763.1 hypothetical protein [Zunongwangia sp. F297]
MPRIRRKFWIKILNFAFYLIIFSSISHHHGKYSIESQKQKAYDYLLSLLENIDQNEIEIISDNVFEQQKEDLHQELEAVGNGTSELCDLDEVDIELDRILSQYEDKTIK